MEFSREGQEGDLEVKTTAEHETTKGTLFSVGVVAAVIFANYLLFFWLYMARV